MEIIHEGWKIVNTVINGVSFQEAGTQNDRLYTLKAANNTKFNDLMLVLEALSLSAPGPFNISEAERRGTKQKYKMRTIENLLELEIGRHYKTEKGIPIVRVSLHDLEIAGKIRLPISSDDDNGDWKFSHNEPTNVALRGIFNPSTAVVAIETFSGRRISNGMTVEVTIKAEREDKSEKQRERNGREKGTSGGEQQGEIKTIFQLSEMVTGAWYLVADTDVKIHPLSRTEFYISYRKRSRPPRVALPATKGLSGIAPWSYTSGQSGKSSSSASSAPPRREDKENERTQISNRIISNLAILGPHNTSSPFLKQKGFGKTIYKSPIRTPATPRSNLRNTFTPTSAEPPSSPGSGSKRKRGAAANEPPFSPYEKKECEPLSSTAPVPPPPPPVSHVPPPPPAPPVAGEEKSKPKRKKMRPLHWNSIPKNQLDSTIWGASTLVDSPSIELDVSEVESIFSLSPVGSPTTREEKKKMVSGGPGGKYISLLSLQRVNNIAILLSHFKMSFEEIYNGIMMMDESVLSIDNIKALCYIAPREDEADMLQSFRGDIKTLGNAERFLLTLLHVPRLMTRLETFLWKLQFPSILAEIAQDVEVVTNACKEVKDSEKLAQILKIILHLGGILNRDNYLSSTSGFKLESLALLTETKGKNRNMTVLQYLKKEVANKRGDLLTFFQDFKSVELAAKVPADHVRAEMHCLKKEMAKLEQEMKLHNELLQGQEEGSTSDRYQTVMTEFHEAAVKDLAALEEKVTQMQQTWMQLAEYFGEDAAKCNSASFFANLDSFIKQFERTTL